MKEVTGKICHKANVSPINAKANASNGDGIRINIVKTDESSSSHSPQNKRKLTPTKFTKF
jgi:hypothetical protein